jgi:hypothetical protein
VPSRADYMSVYVPYGPDWQPADILRLMRRQVRLRV